MNDDNVEAILVNVFGGIVRCDRVARYGSALIILDQSNSDYHWVGTNAQAKDIIDNSGLEVVSAVSLQSAADKVKVLDN